jgi:hypothetical protein
VFHEILINSSKYSRIELKLTIGDSLEAILNYYSNMAEFMRRIELIRRRHRLTSAVERIIPDIINPLEFLSRTDVRERYRFEPESILFMLQLISKSTGFDTFRSLPLPPIISLLVTLNRAHYLIIGDRHGVSKSSVSRAIKRTSTAICAIRKKCIHFPSDHDIPAVRTGVL